MLLANGIAALSDGLVLEWLAHYPRGNGARLYGGAHTGAIGGCSRWIMDFLQCA
jgi:hypothetical protein